MKSTFSALFILFVTLFASCKKEEVKPVTPQTAASTPNAPKDVALTYKIYAESGNYTMSYTMPNEAGDKLIVNHVTINRMVHTIDFNWKTGNKFKIEATNVMPSTKEITVEIYVNGILFSSGIANSPNGVASAEAMLY